MNPSICVDIVRHHNLLRLDIEMSMKKMRGVKGFHIMLPKEVEDVR